MREEEREHQNDRENTTPSESESSTPDRERRYGTDSKEHSTETATGTCEECGGDITTDQSSGETICTECGLIVDDQQVIDRGPEWRAYTSSERREKSRTGAPLTELRHDRGLSTDIDWKNKDAYGQELSSQKRRQMRRLRKWDFRAKRDSSSNNIAYANGEIKRMGAALGVPKNIQETAAALYREAHNNELVPGRSIEGMASATLYIALRIHNEPRSLDEVTRVARIERKPLQRAYRYICRELDIGLKPADPSRYIPRFATKLNAPQSMVKTAEDLLSDLTGTHHVSGNDPTVLAAAALYAAAILDSTLLTQADVKEASDVTEVSIRNNYEMFLLHSSVSPVTESDIEQATTPRDLAERIHDSVTYFDPENPDEISMSTDSETSDTTDTDSPVADTDSSDSEPEDSLDGVRCPDCSDVVETTDELITHLDDEHTVPDAGGEFGDDEYNFSCPACPRVTHTYAGLTAHISRVHQDDDTAQGTRKQYAIPSDVHPIRDSNGTRIKNLTCTHCNTDTETAGEGDCEEFQSYWALRVHQTRVHDGQRNPDDYELPEDASERPEYTDNEYNFACNTCECVFDTFQGLSIHMGHEHAYTEKYSRSAYAVNPAEYSIYTARDRANEPDDEPDPFTIGDTDTGLLSADEAGYVISQTERLFDEYDHDFHPAVQQLTQTLLAVGGTSIGDCHYRSVDTAIAAALYAATIIAEPVIETEYTQQDISTITSVSKNPISKGYGLYLDTFEEFTTETDRSP